MGNEAHGSNSALESKEQHNIGDWAAPVIVWLLFIGMGLAMVSVLLSPSQ
jgi:hypothetical protein